MRQVIDYINIISETCDKYKKDEAVDTLVDIYAQTKDKIAFVTAMTIFAAEQRNNVKLYSKSINKAKEGE